MDLELHQLDRRYEGLRARSARRERRLLSSLSEVGQQTPIVVVRDDTQWVVVDGYKRVRAVHRLGQDVVRATEWAMSEAEALVLERTLRSGDADSAIEQGWLVRGLMQRFGLGLEELSRRFDRSVSWVSRRLGLVTELPPAVQEQVRLGAIGAHAAMKYLVPLARANASDCEALGQALGALRPTSRQVAELYVAYTGGNPTVRERVVQQPGLVLKARMELSRAGAELSASEQLLHDLRIAASVARRARRRVCEGALDGARDTERARALEQSHEAHFELERLLARLKQETTEVQHAGSNDQGRDSAPA